MQRKKELSVSTSHSGFFNKCANYVSSENFVSHNANWNWFVASAVTLGYGYDMIFGSGKASLAEYGLDVALHVWDALVKSGQLEALMKSLEIPHNPTVAYLSTYPANLIRFIDIYRRADFSTIPTALNYLDLVNHAYNIAASTTGTLHTLAEPQEERRSLRSVR
jgi:hypothetical protein